LFLFYSSLLLSLLRLTHLIHDLSLFKLSPLPLSQLPVSFDPLSLLIIAKHVSLWQRSIAPVSLGCCCCRLDDRDDAGVLEDSELMILGVFLDHDIEEREILVEELPESVW
jgi:hypothetical protein